MNNDLAKKEFLETSKDFDISFETRAIPGIIFNEFFEKYGQGEIQNITIDKRPYQMIYAVVKEDVCAAYMGLAQYDEKIEIVIWAWKPVGECVLFGNEPKRNLAVMCGPTVFGGWDSCNGQKYENQAHFNFPVSGYEAGGPAAMLAAMVQMRVCELLNDPRYEKTETFFRK